MSRIEDLLADEKVGLNTKNRFWQIGMKNNVTDFTNKTRDVARREHMSLIAMRKVEVIDMELAILQQKTNLLNEEKQILVNKYNLKFDASVASAVSIPNNWTDAYPLFHLEVTGEKYTFVNETGYNVKKDFVTEQKQKNYFQKFNKQECNKVKRVGATICANGGDVKNDVYTNGWVPIQDTVNKENNKYVAYFVEYEDGTSGWLRWCAYDFAVYAVLRTFYPLCYLANFSDYQADARAAALKCVKTSGR